MNCQEYREIVAAHVDGALSVHEESAVQSHLAGCANCTRMFRWETEATKAIKQQLSTVTVDAHLKERILERLAQPPKPSFFGWPVPIYSLAGAAAIILIAISTLLLSRPDQTSDIFTNIIAQHRVVIAGTNTAAMGLIQSSVDPPLDLRPWGYNLRAYKPAELNETKGTTFVYATTGNEYILAQEFKGGNISLSAGAKTLDADGKQFHSDSRDGVNLIAWKDNDVLCILAARLPQDALLRIAERLAATS